MSHSLRALVFGLALAALLAPQAARCQEGAVATPAVLEASVPQPTAAAPAARIGLTAKPAQDDSLADRPDWAEPGSSASLAGALARMVLVLALVLALIYLTLNYGLRRLMRMPQRASMVTVHERVPLEPKKSVYVVEAAGEYLLVGVGEHEVSLVAKLDPEKARLALARKEPADKPPARPFWERLIIKKPSPSKPEGGDPT